MKLVDGIEAMEGQEHETDQIAERVSQRQDLGGHAAFGAAYGLALSPPFAPWPWRWALTMVAQQLMSVKSPSEMLELCTTHARKQFETLTEQTKGLTMLGQRVVTESTEPVTKAFNKVA